MASSLRELRQRRKSVTATKKITKAMELIAASKVIRAQQAARRALPYTRDLNRAVSALATHTRNLDHPLTTQVEKPRRAALVVFTSDRGMNGAFNSNVLKVAAQMRTRLEDQGMEVKRYVVGRKGMAYMKFRQPASLFALIGVFVAQTPDGARVAVTGGGNGVFRQTAMEQALTKSFTPEAIADIRTDASEINGDLHGSAEYRAHLVGVMAQRAVAKAVA